MLLVQQQALLLLSGLAYGTGKHNVLSDSCAESAVHLQCGPIEKVLK